MLTHGTTTWADQSAKMSTAKAQSTFQISIADLLWRNWKPVTTCVLRRVVAVHGAVSLSLADFISLLISIPACFIKVLYTRSQCASAANAGYDGMRTPVSSCVPEC